jgi:hypothetical protein
LLSRENGDIIGLVESMNIPMGNEIYENFTWDRGSKSEPYFTGTLGLTHFNPEDSGVDSPARFSMGFGGGVRYFPVKRFGLYTGARDLVAIVKKLEKSLLTIVFQGKCWYYNIT